MPPVIDDEEVDDEILDEPEGEEDAPDEGGDGGDAEEESPDGEEEQDDEVDRRPSRRERRIETLARTTREANERAARLEREIAELKAQRPVQQQQHDPRAEEERLALMTPDERIEYRLQKQEESTRRTLAQMQFQSQEAIDKAEYRARTATSRIHAKYEADVEKELATLRAQGQNVPRQTILEYLVGKNAVARMTTEAPKQKAKGKDNIRRQQTRPTSGRGDVAADRRASGKTVAKRLENVPI